MTLKDHLEKIGEELDEKELLNLASLVGTDASNPEENLIRFINDHLLSTNKETIRIVREMAEGMRKETPYLEKLDCDVCGGEDEQCQRMRYSEESSGYNQALEDIIKALEV